MLARHLEVELLAAAASALLTSAECTEVLSGPGDHIRTELRRNKARGHTPHTFSNANARKSGLPGEKGQEWARFHKNYTTLYHNFEIAGGIMLLGRR